MEQGANNEEERQDRREPRGKPSRRIRLRGLFGIVASTVILVVGSVVLSVLACLTLFRLRAFYSEQIVSRMARLGLWCAGIKVVEHRSAPFSSEQTVYISNHTSLLDFFVVTALGLPNTRYFLSGFLRRIVPIGVIGYIIGVFWTAPQSQGPKRTRLFQRAERVLRRTGDSVFLTPEGQVIGRFNKGAFHLATALKVPIQPIYLHIPNEIDPGPWSSFRFNKADVRSGVVEVHYQEAIDTSEWKVADVAANRDAVKELYREWQKTLAQG